MSIESTFNIEEGGDTSVPDAAAVTTEDTSASDATAVTTEDTPALDADAVITADMSAPTEDAGTTEGTPAPKSREEVAWYLSLGLGRMPDYQELDEAMGITANTASI